MSDTIGKLEALIISDMPKDTMNEALALLSALSATEARAEAAEAFVLKFRATDHIMDSQEYADAMNDLMEEACRIEAARTLKGAQDGR